MTEYQLTVSRYDEIPVPGKPLGRQIAFDSRSLAYPYRVARVVPVVDVKPARHISILQQGGTGSCEGNAEVGCSAYRPVWDALSIVQRQSLGEPKAVALYSAATKLDPFPGQYPPTDTGTDSTSVSKAAKADGLISGYTHVATVADLLQAIMGSATNFAFDWYEGFDDPAPSGLVTIAGAVRGGHALCAWGIDADRKLIWLDNSWGPEWGKDGTFCMSWDTADHLLSTNGEAVVPVPLSVPPPAPADPDQVFAAVLSRQNAAGQPWTLQRHSGYVTTVAKAGQAWLDSLPPAGQ